MLHSNQKNSELKYSDNELKQITQIQVFFLSDDQKKLLTTIYDIISTNKIEKSLRELFIAFQNDESGERITKFTSAYGLNKQDLLVLIDESLDLPAPKINNTKNEVKEATDKLVTLKQKFQPLEKIGLTHSSCQLIFHYYEGVTTENIIDVLNQLPNTQEYISQINAYLSKRTKLRLKKTSRMRYDGLERVRIQFESSECSQFFRKIFKYSDHGKGIN